MTIIIMAKEDGEKVTIQRCRPDRWCKHLKTFLEHTFTDKNKSYGIEVAEMERHGEITPGLVYRMPRSKGYFVSLKFCPFCGGAVSDRAFQEYFNCGIREVEYDETMEEKNTDENN